MNSVEGLSRDALKAEISNLRRMLWCIISGIGVEGRVMLFPSDLESYPGDDRAAIEMTKDKLTGNTIFAAISAANHPTTPDTQ